MLRFPWVPSIALIVITGLLIACAERPVTDYSPTRDFSSLHKYTWTGISPQEQKDPVLYNALTEQRIHEAVDEELGSRGYQKVVEAQADFLVTYHLVVRQKVQGNSVGVGFGMFNAPFGMGGNVVLSQYSEGELFVDLLEPTTQALIWRGSLRYPVSDGQSPEERASAIRQKVSVILSKFPP